MSDKKYIRFIQCDRNQYNTLDTSIDPNALYFIVDAGELYLGNIPIADNTGNLTQLSNSNILLWNFNSNINDYIDSGIYRFVGKRENTSDGLPVDINDEGVSITLINDTNEEDNFISQTMILSYLSYPHARLFMRTCDKNKMSLTTWCETVNSRRLYINDFNDGSKTDEVLNNIISSCICYGEVNGTDESNILFNTGDTFVLNTITDNSNDYQVCQTMTVISISGIRYNHRYKRNDVWSSWSIIKTGSEYFDSTDSIDDYIKIRNTEDNTDYYLNIRSNREVYVDTAVYKDKACIFEIGRYIRVDNINGTGEIEIYSTNEHIVVTNNGLYKQAVYSKDVLATEQGVVNMLKGIIVGSNSNNNNDIVLVLENNYLKLKNHRGEDISSLDITSLKEDNMIESVELVDNPEEKPAGVYFVLYYKDSSKEPLFVCVDRLINNYTSSGSISISNNNITLSVEDNKPNALIIGGSSNDIIKSSGVEIIENDIIEDNNITVPTSKAVTTYVNRSLQNHTPTWERIN